MKDALGSARTDGFVFSRKIYEKPNTLTAPKLPLRPTSLFAKLKLEKSSIHNWGVFAMETINPGSIVIEYVGEKIRESMADARERTNDAVYFFRLDDDTIVDATRCGNISRFINHKCQVCHGEF